MWTGAEDTSASDIWNSRKVMSSQANRQSSLVHSERRLPPGHFSLFILDQVEKSCLTSAENSITLSHLTQSATGSMCRDLLRTEGPGPH